MSNWKFTGITVIPDDFYDQLEGTYGTPNGYLIYPKAEEIALPWDADMFLDDDNNIVLEGSCVGGSANTPYDAGYCRVVVSKEKFNRFYDLDVEEESADDPEGCEEYMYSLGFTKA